MFLLRQCVSALSKDCISCRVETHSLGETKVMSDSKGYIIHWFYHQAAGSSHVMIGDISWYICISSTWSWMYMDFCCDVIFCASSSAKRQSSGDTLGLLQWGGCKTLKNQIPATIHFIHLFLTLHTFIPRSSVTSPSSPWSCSVDYREHNWLSFTANDFLLICSQTVAHCTCFVWSMGGHFKEDPDVITHTIKSHDTGELFSIVFIHFIIASVIYLLAIGQVYSHLLLKFGYKYSVSLFNSKCISSFWRIVGFFSVET